MVTSTGVIVSIHVAPQAAAPMQAVPEARAVPGKGLVGDRYFAGSVSAGTFAKPGDPSREVTLIEIEAIEALGRDGQVTIEPGAARRNLVTRGVALNHLVGREFAVGAVRLRGIRLCEPCAHLEGLTRPGVKAGLVHRGGLRAQILVEGVIHAGDAVGP